MTLEAWSDSGLITPHQSTPHEVSDLLAVVDTDLRDAAIPELSLERKLGCCYGAILSAARAALHASGYRISRSTRSHHYYVIQSLRYTIGLDLSTLLQVEAVQKKRNTADYVRSGEVSEALVAEVTALAHDTSKAVRQWLVETHPDLLPG